MTTSINGSAQPTSAAPFRSRLRLPTPRTLICLTLALLLFCITLAVDEVADTAEPVVQMYGLTLTQWSASKLPYLTALAVSLLLADIMTRFLCRDDTELGTCTMAISAIGYLLVGALITFTAAVSNHRAGLIAADRLFSTLYCVLVALAVLVFWQFGLWIRRQQPAKVESA